MNIVRDQKGVEGKSSSSQGDQRTKYSVGGFKEAFARDFPMWGSWHTASHGLNSKVTFTQALSAALTQPTLYPSECSELLPLMKTHYNFGVSMDPVELIPETPSQKPHVLQDRHILSSDNSLYPISQTSSSLGVKVKMQPWRSCEIRPAQVWEVNELSVLCPSFLLSLAVACLDNCRYICGS